MKIIAIGRNYSAHAKELNNEIPDKPVIFMKPDTAVLKNNKPFYYPEFSSEIHYEIEIVIKISKEGKHIAKKFAHKYYEEIGIGIDFTARDVQKKLKEKGLPWEIAKSFDNSAAISEFVSIEEFPDLKNIIFSLNINDQQKQIGNTKDMMISFEDIISYVSQYITLKKGDLIFTGTPQGVGKINIGDKLQGYLEDRLMLNFEIK